MKILSTTEQALQRAFPGEALARTHATLSQNGVVEPYSRVARRLLEAELRGERLEARRLATATATVPDVAARTPRQFQRQGVIALKRGAPRILDRRALHEAARCRPVRRCTEMLCSCSLP